MRSVKVKAIIVNALNYTFLKGLLLHSKTSPFAHQNESFCSSKRVLLQAKRSPFENPRDFSRRAKGKTLKSREQTTANQTLFTGSWNAETVGGYGVPAIA